MDFFLFCCRLTGLPSSWRRVCGSCLPCPAANWLSMRIFHIENNFDPADRTLASQLFAQAWIVPPSPPPSPPLRPSPARGPSLLVLINHWPLVAVPCASVCVRLYKCPWRVRANVILVVLITKFHKAGPRPFERQMRRQVAERKGNYSENQTQFLPFNSVLGYEPGKTNVAHYSGHQEKKRKEITFF